MRVVDYQKSEALPAYRWLHGLAIAAGVFSFVVLSLLVANHLALKRSDPIHAPALLKLTEDLKAAPQSEELREQIRELDYLARRAFFSSQHFQQIAILLLLAAAAVTVVAWKSLQTYRLQAPFPSPHPPKEDLAANAKWARGAITAAGIVLIGLALSLAIPWQSPLDEALAPKPIAASPALPSLEEFAKNWPAFLGFASGHALSTNLPLDWDGPSGKGVKWKTAIPKPGRSSPIIWNDRIFLTGGDTAGREVYCLDTETGAMLWTHQATDIPGSPASPPKASDDTTLAAPTMATDGARVFALFGTGDLLALDFEGKRLWAKNLGTPDNPYGHGSSLVVEKDLLLAQLDQRTNGMFLCMDTATGDLRKKIARTFEPSWASPLVIDEAGKRRVILASAPAVASYDLETGAELWRVKCLEHSEVAPTPIFANGFVYVSGTDAGLTAIEIATKKAAWKRDENIPGVATPLAAAALLIFGMDNGGIVCLNARTGEQLWETDTDDGFYASPILAGDRVYLTDRSGTTYVFNATNKFNSLGKLRLGEDVSATPAVKDNSLFIRGHKHLFRIGL